MTILFVTGTRHIDHPTDNPPDGRIFATSTLLKIPRHDPTGATQQVITADVATAAGNTGADTTTADMIRMTMINKTCKCGCHDAGHAQWTKAKYGLAVEAYVEHKKKRHSATADMIRMTMINKTCKCGCHGASKLRLFSEWSPLFFTSNIWDSFGTILSK